MDLDPSIHINLWFIDLRIRRRSTGAPTQTMNVVRRTFSDKCRRFIEVSELDDQWEYPHRDRGEQPARDATQLVRELKLALRTDWIYMRLSGLDLVRMEDETFPFHRFNLGVLACESVDS